VARAGPVGLGTDDGDGDGSIVAVPSGAPIEEEMERAAEAEAEKEVEPEPEPAELAAFAAAVVGAAEDGTEYAAQEEEALPPTSSAFAGAEMETVEI